MDSHEIWHASTEKWNRLGDERGVLQKTISIDEPANADTEDSSNNSDSVIELSSDEEEEEEINNEESDDSSDIEILEEIPFKPHQMENHVPTVGKEMPESKPPKETVSEDESCLTKELSSSISDDVVAEENNSMHDNDVSGANKQETENGEIARTNAIKDIESDKNVESVDEADKTGTTTCEEPNGERSSS